MKKISLIALFFLLLVILVPVSASAFLVPCGNSPGPDTPPSTVHPCGINDFFQMLNNIYDFIVKMIATPLAVIALIIGGIFMMASAGDPGVFGKGKEIVKWAIIGLALVWGSWIIINFILTTLGYAGNWSTL